MAPVVEAHGIAKQFGSLVAVEDITVAVEAGEVLGILGPNGAGKTTAVRILTTILAPSRGSFSVAGVPHTRPEDIRRQIGVLPESAGYPGGQTGEQYLTYHARLYGHSRARAGEVARSLLEELGLLERSHSPISTYSRGMRQRLGIARALVNDPVAVFLDEPTLGLDPAGQLQVLRHVRTIARERGAAVLLSTHLLNEVEENCSHVLILNRGRVIADGTVAEVISRAAAPRRARLQVPAEQAERAAGVLADVPVVERIELADGQSGWLTIEFAAPAGNNGGAPAPGDSIRALLDAGIELRSFELDGTRLSDAFLAMTGAI
ncbi:MAG TPA: ABC transporter ATP-binding protein [Gaiellales bacterium]|nr:ABC transporter ATP-binding protein [Gaiellales bacterium]